MGEGSWVFCPTHVWRCARLCIRERSQPEWVNDIERNDNGEGCPFVGPRPRAGEDATDALVPLQLDKYDNGNVLDSYDLDVEEQLNPQLRFHQVHSQQ